jgi:SAM-dependent methyltransferase
MEIKTSEKPEYGNWVSKRLTVAPAVLGLICLLLALVFPVSILLAVLFLLVSAYFAYARRLFSPQGGDVQAQVLDLLLAEIEWDGAGQALDIGCGSGALVIELACRYPGARITGVDNWGEKWEYSKSLCEKNAAITGVAERVSFQSASASALPFEDGKFDLVVSNLTFHEVSAVKDKRDALKEALRMVRKGGRFAFQDLFLWKRIYGEVDDLLETVRGWGVDRVEFIDTSKAPFIPPALKLSFMVGTIGVIYGEK